MQYQNLIIDGTNLEFRIFYVAKNMKTMNASGEQTSCIFRFLLSFRDLVERFKPDNIYACWDKKLTWPSTNFRKEILIDKYKAGRVKPDDIEEMYEQEIKLVEILESLGVKNIFPNVLEADDVIGWLSKKLDGTKLIVSVDQDLLQLVDDNTSIYTLKKIINKQNFEVETGVPLKDYKLYKAIKGDTSDNISGLPGYGVVRSRKLASQWDSSNVSEEFKNIVERNLKLVDLDYGFKIQPDEEEAYKKQFEKEVEPDIDKFKTLCERYEFTTYLENLKDWEHIIKRNNIVNLINTLKEI